MSSPRPTKHSSNGGNTLQRRTRSMTALNQPHFDQPSLLKLRVWLKRMKGKWEERSLGSAKPSRTNSFAKRKSKTLPNSSSNLRQLYSQDNAQYRFSSDDAPQRASTAPPTPPKERKLPAVPEKPKTLRSERRRSIQPPPRFGQLDLLPPSRLKSTPPRVIKFVDNPERPEPARRIIFEDDIDASDVEAMGSVYPITTQASSNRGSRFFARTPNLNNVPIPGTPFHQTLPESYLRRSISTKKFGNWRGSTVVSPVAETPLFTFLRDDIRLGRRSIVPSIFQVLDNAPDSIQKKHYTTPALSRHSAIVQPAF